MMRVNKVISGAATKVALFVAMALGLSACIEGQVTNGPSINPNKAVTVALLVPSGSGNAQQEALASSFVQAAKLAVANLEDAKIELKVYPTQGNPTVAANAAAQAANDGAKIIIGPLFAEAANAAGKAVAGRGINVLSFSNNTAIAGGNVFVLGNTFQNTANRLVRFAASKGLRKVAVVAAQNAAGELAANSVRSAAVTAGATFAGTANYEFSQQGVVVAVPEIRKTVQGSGAQALIFTSDTAGALPILAQLLPENGLDSSNIQFMGLTRWDIPPSTLSLPGLQGGWFTLPDTGLYNGFRERYQASYGGAPHPLAGLAYDGIAAVGALLKTGERDALTRAKLTRSGGFVGVNGVFRLNSDGTNQRGLAIGQVDNGTVKIISAAPRGFGGAGF